MLPRVDAHIGTRMRLRVRARDVMVATERPRGVSALNIMPGVIGVVSIGGQDAYVAIDCGGDRIMARDGDFDAIICDLRMPDMDGHSFYQWVSATKPLLADRVVFITGDALSSRASDLVLTGRQVLEKPLRPAEILAALSALHPER